MLHTVRRFLPFSIAPLAIVFAACGSSVESSTKGDSGSATASTSSSSVSSSSVSGAGGNPCYPDSCSGPSVGPTTGTGGGGGAGMCGGFAGDTCPAEAFCNYPNDDCGGADGPGSCAPKPGGCPKNEMPACGCDGKVYGNPCEANSAGVDVSNLGGCTPPAGMFTCGWTFCTTQQYCQREVSDVGGIPDSYACLALPAACTMGAPETCACLANEACGTNCTQGADGNLTVFCPGG